MFFISDGSCVNEVDSLGRSPLMYAVHFNQLQTVHLLVQSGCDVNHVAHGKLCTAYICMHLLYLNLFKPSHSIVNAK